VEISLPNGLDRNSWILANVKHAGFYRVNYDSNNWNLLIDQLNNDHTLIDSTSRAQLIDDSFNLGRAEKLDQLLYLRLLNYLKKETDPLPFSAAFNGLDYIADMLLSDFDAFEMFKVFKLNLFFILNLLTDNSLQIHRNSIEIWFHHLIKG
jgi:aminopeptidase N